MTMFEFIGDDPDTPVPHTAGKAPGKVRFDERGTAIYERNDTQVFSNGQSGQQLPERAMLNSTLSLVDDDPTTHAPRVENQKGLRLGYNPYESGHLSGKSTIKKKHDIRELSKWIELQRRLGLYQKD